MQSLNTLWEKLRALGQDQYNRGILPPRPLQPPLTPEREAELAHNLGFVGEPDAEAQTAEPAAQVAGAEAGPLGIMAARTGPAYLRGVDVSHHNGTIDWPALAGAGYSFAFIKASEGSTFTDPNFRRNWSGAGRAGILRGAYHYFRPSIAAEPQLQHFLDVMGPLGPGDLQPVLDFEESDDIRASKVIDRAAAMLFGIADRTGRDPIIYSYPFFYKYTLGDPTLFAGQYPLWIAHYDVPRPALFGGWPYWSFWQFTSTGRAPGIAGRVDLNYFNGKLGQLRKFAGYT